MSEPAFPCPCCGYLVFAEGPGSYDICPICFWEDDPVQLRWPSFAGGSNRPSLIESQSNFRVHGAMEARSIGNVRPATESEARDEQWRLFDPTTDTEEPWSAQDPWPDDYTSLYYWRRSPAP